MRNLVVDVLSVQAEALAAGAREVEGVDVEIYRVAETLPEEVLVKMGALDAVRSLEDLPLATPEGIEGADAVVFGSPTRFGNMSAQLKTFFDQVCHSQLPPSLPTPLAL